MPGESSVGEEEVLYVGGVHDGSRSDGGGPGPGVQGLRVLCQLAYQLLGGAPYHFVTLFRGRVDLGHQHHLPILLVPLLVGLAWKKKTVATCTYVLVTVLGFDNSTLDGVFKPFLCSYPLT